MIPLFDLGNVVVRVDFSPFLKWLQEKAGRSDEGWAASFLTSSIYIDYETGALTRAEFTAKIEEFTAARLSPKELRGAYCSIFPEAVPGMAALLKDLAQKGPIYALSNTNEMHLEHLMQHYPEMHYFKRVYASQDLGMRKPAPKIYAETARLIGVPADSLVFFDDLEPNISGAKFAGLEAHLFEDASQVAAILKSSR